MYHPFLKPEFTNSSNLTCDFVSHSNYFHFPITKIAFISLTQFTKRPLKKLDHHIVVKFTCSQGISLRLFLVLLKSLFQSLIKFHNYSLIIHF